MLLVSLCLQSTTNCCFPATNRQSIHLKHHKRPVIKGTMGIRDRWFLPLAFSVLSGFSSFCLSWFCPAKDTLLPFLSSTPPTVLTESGSVHGRRAFSASSSGLLASTGFTFLPNVLSVLADERSLTGLQISKVSSGLEWEHVGAEVPDIPLVSLLPSEPKGEVMAGSGGLD
jgi:hypothetical protein